MTSAADRRLAKLEGALRPREAVLAWLAEAHRYATINEYGRWIAEVPIEAAPLSVIARQVEAAVRQDMKGQSRDAVEDAVHRAIREALFLFVLAFQINIDAVEMDRVEGLRAAAVFFWMGCLLGGPRDEDLPAQELAEHHRELASAWASWRSVVDRLDEDAQAATRARATLSQRYYGGHDVLFGDAATSWAKHIQTVERLKSLAETITYARKSASRPAGGRKRSRPSVQGEVDGRVSWLTQWSKVRAHEVLGERPKAVAIMERWLLREPEQPSASSEDQTL
jgi:hypothetical protein